MTKILEVYLKDHSVGFLEQDSSGSLGFTYAEAWLKFHHAVALSASLPLRAEPFRRNECRPFFAGLLPEETSRELIAKAFGVSEKNDFAILERIGAECAGAVSLIPLGETRMSGASSYREISTQELAAYIAQLPQKPLLAGQEGIRLSLAGAQGKLAVAIFEETFFLPLNGSPSTHILKPQGPHFEQLVENEFFCMKLAALAGFEVAAVEIGTAGDARFLQVERYDRELLDQGRLERIHQEDFCQAMGIPPELKYQQEGGPNLKKCFELIRSVTSVPGPEVLRLFDAVIFNYLIGNNDAHGKNFSLLCEPRNVKIAPLYDLVCTQAYLGLAAESAMKLGDERKPERVIPRNWKKFFNDAGVGPAIAKKRLDELAHQVSEIVRKIDPTYPGWTLVSPIILQNCQRVFSLNWKVI